MERNWGKRSLVLAGVALGLVLQYVGYRLSEPNPDLILAGSAIVPLSLLWGGLFLSEEGSALRVTLLAVAGILLLISVSLIGTILSIGSMF
jgi:hypothetical protein